MTRGKTIKTKSPEGNPRDFLRLYDFYIIGNPSESKGGFCQVY